MGGKNAFLQGKGRAVAEIPKDELKNIKQKTLIIYGENDKFFSPKYSELAAQIIPNAKLKNIRNAGHMPLMDQVEIFNKSLIEFLRE
ncbi:AB hydrolase superfamily protein YdjP [compost metagenome]